MRGSTIQQRPVRRPRGRTGALVVLAAVAVLAAACGEPASEAGAADAPEGSTEEPVEEAPEPAEDPVEDDVEEEPAEEPEAVGEGEGPDDGDDPTEEAPPAEDETCGIAVGTGTPMGQDDYLDLIDPVNGALEELLYDVEASLAALEEGGDGPSLETELLDHRDTWEQIVEPVDGVTPATGAEDWHDDVLESWVAVCDTIEDGYHGSADGDDQRFDAFVDALREFPSLFNHLHANAACGPFEDC